jgi:hypothetical protein
MTWFSTPRLVALVVASSFAAGLNVYATVVTLGVLARVGIIELPASLNPIATWWVIGPSFALYVLEFVADKIPVVDLVWNALQTFVRVPVAAFLAYETTLHLSAPEQLMATLLGGGIAFVAHSGKLAARVAVTPSPEPFSNIALSLGEDATAISLSWFAGRHPYYAAALAIVLLVVVIVLAKRVFLAVRMMFNTAHQRIESMRGRTA